MGISFNSDDDVTDEILEKLIRGELDKTMKSTVEMLVKNSSKVFIRYMELKEINFFETASKPLTTDLKNKIKSNFPKSENNFSHSIIRIKYSKDKYIISSSDQETLEYIGVMTKIEKQDNELVSIIVNHMINKNKISNEFIPNYDQNFFALRIQSTQLKNIDCELWKNDEKIETISDIQNQKTFDSKIPMLTNFQLKFIISREIASSISIYLTNQ